MNNAKLTHEDIVSEITRTWTEEEHALVRQIIGDIQYVVTDYRISCLMEDIVINGI